MGCTGLTGESQYLSFMGTRVHFRVAQPEVDIKNRILLLSSPLINTFHWRKLLPELTELGCLAVIVDMPGFGLSDCRAPRKTETLANIIWGILDNVDQALDSPMSLWHLAGHGSACAVILEMAALYPDSVKSQIHISPAFSPKLSDDCGKWFDVNIRDERRFHRMIERYSGYPMDNYIVDRMRRPFMRPGARESFIHMYNAVRFPEHGMGFCPTMALWGGLDQLIDNEGLSLIHSLLPDAETHILKSAGHFPMETHSKAMRDYLRGWIRYND